MKPKKIIVNDKMQKNYVYYLTEKEGKNFHPEFKPEWISETELVDSGLAKRKRSNNIMQSSNLEKLGIKMRPVYEAVEECMKNYKT